jgi:ParB-like nuclease domain
MNETPKAIIKGKEPPMAKPKIETVPLDKIQRDPALNCRAQGVDESIAQEYAAALVDGAQLPSVVVYLEGETYRLADGFHRCRAFELAGKTEVPCEVRPGGEREARLFAVGANATHGARRTNADKRCAVLVLLRDSEWSARPLREIAALAAVDHKTIHNVKEELKASGEIPQAAPKFKISKVSKRKKKAPKKPDPVRAGKLARKDLDKLAKRWTEPVAVPAVQAWLAERVNIVAVVPAGPAKAVG